MAKVFNVSGACKPTEHYMVDLESRLEVIRSMVNLGEYFAINKARQYGKTTTLRALAVFLKKDYVVISLDFEEISGLIYDYTSGYPFLVSRLCKLMDEKIAGTENFEDKKKVWTKAGMLEAVKRLLSEKNTLFESLIRQLNEYPELKDMIYLLMFQGQVIAYNADDQAMDMLLMLGFVKVEHETVQIANRIFETRLYNYFLTLDSY